MFISSDIIFLHVPKCGGKSVVEALRSRHCPEIEARREIHVYNPWGASLPEPHMLASTLRRTLGEQVWAGTWKFALVRHPIDRLVSWYHYGADKLVKRGDPFPFMSWEHFLEFVIGTADPVFDLGDNRAPWHRARILQSEWLDEEIEVIYKLEELRGGFFAYGSHYRLPHINQSTHPPASQFPVPAHVLEYLKPDFERFDYQPAAVGSSS